MIYAPADSSAGNREAMTLTKHQNPDQLDAGCISDPAPELLSNCFRQASEEKQRARPSLAKPLKSLVELMRVELTTSAVRLQRSPN